MITCVRCKADYPDGTDFSGRKICPKCYSKQAAGRASYNQKQEQKQMAEQKADETYLQVEPVRVRPKRTPLTARQQLANHNTPEGYVDHWFTDKPGKLAAAEEAGWEYVKGENVGARMVEGNRLPGSVTAKPVGLGDTGVLMRKRKDEYEEDMGLLEERNKKREEAILAPEEQNSSFYTRKDVPIRIGANLHERQIKPIR